MGLNSILMKFPPYRWGVGIGDALKVKPDDGLGTKILKRGLLGVAAPLAAGALVYIAAQALFVLVPLAPYLPFGDALAPILSVLPTPVPGELRAIGGIMRPLMPFLPSLGSLLAEAFVYTTAGVVASGLAVAGLAGMSKNAVKENIGSLKSLFKGTEKESHPVAKSTPPGSTNEFSLIRDEKEGIERITGSQKGFSQKYADELVEIARVRGWTEISVDGGSRKQKEMLWLSAQIEQKISERKQQEGGVQPGAGCVPITIIGLSVTEKDEIYKKWKEAEADMNKTFFPAEASKFLPQEASPRQEKKPENKQGNLNL
ncbi:MAG: hypothetical protein V1721_04460 [Pseudomonadota bacterium]